MVTIPGGMALNPDHVIADVAILITFLIVNQIIVLCWR
ncbi:hypothetical protein K3495_g15200 [Podosphaera aphanis]|nr:hypothetical protein K3495_g15200 [Podosphaera aphanis]